MNDYVEIVEAAQKRKRHTELAAASMFSLALAAALLIFTPVPGTTSKDPSHDLKTAKMALADAEVARDLQIASDTLSSAGVNTTSIVRNHQTVADPKNQFVGTVNDIPYLDSKADAKERTHVQGIKANSNTVSYDADEKEKGSVAETRDKDTLEANDIALLEDCNILVVSPDEGASVSAIVIGVEDGKVSNTFSVENLDQTALEIQSVSTSRFSDIEEDDDENYALMTAAVEDLADIEITYCAEGDIDKLLDTNGELKNDELPTSVRSHLADLANQNRKTVIDDEMWYDQNAYPGQYYQYYYDIPTYGCGLCATTNAVNMLLNKHYDAPEVASMMENWAAENGGISYCVEEGTAYDEWAKVVSGCFNLDVRKAESIEDVKDALLHGAIIVSGHDGDFRQRTGGIYWTGGHIICFYKTDGSSVWAKDSAGSLGGPCIEYTASEFENYWSGSASRTYIISRPMVQ